MDNERNNPNDDQRNHSSEQSSKEPNQPVYEPYAQAPVLSDPSPIPTGPPKQSGLGIASFIISLVAVVFIIAAFVCGFMFADQIANNEIIFNQPSDIETLDEATLIPVMLTGLFIIAAIGVALIGLILGIIGACFKNRRKTFSVIGIVLNGLIVIGAAAVVIIGLAMSASAINSFA